MPEEAAKKQSAISFQLFLCCLFHNHRSVRCAHAAAAATLLSCAMRTLPTDSSHANHQSIAREKRHAHRWRVVDITYPPQRINKNQSSLTACSVA